MKALKIARKPSIIELVFAGGICVLGIVFLVFVSNHHQAGVKESELVIVEGIPSDVNLETIFARGPHETLHFKLAGHPMQYEGSDPRYADVKAALAIIQPVKAWLLDGTTLYKLTAGDREILSYNDTERENERKDKMSPIIPWALIGLGAFGFYINWKQLQNFKSNSGRL